MLGQHLAQAGAGLEGNLAAMQSQYGLQQQSQLQDLLRSLLGSQLGYQGQQQGNLQNLLRLGLTPRTNQALIPGTSGAIQQTGQAVAQSITISLNDGRNIMAILQLGKEFASGAGQFGEELGQSFGTGLSNVLQHLASQKMRDISTRKQAQGIKALFPNISEQQAYAYAQNPELAKQYYKSELARPGEEAYARMLGGDQSGQQQEQFNLPSLGQFLSPQQQQARGIIPEVATPQQSIPIGSKTQAPRLNERQATKLAEINLKKQEMEQRQSLARQAREERLNRAQVVKEEKIADKAKPYITKLATAAPLATKMKTLSNDMLDLINTGKVATGISGTAAEKFPQFSSNETQQFIAKSNELAGLLAASGKGVPTNFKIKLAQISKPIINQSKATQTKLIKDIIKEVEPILLEERASKEIIDEHNGKIPDNFENLVKKRTHKLIKESHKSQVQLPSANEYSEDAIIQIGDQKYERVGNQWNPID